MLWDVELMDHEGHHAGEDILPQQLTAMPREVKNRIRGSQGNFLIPSSVGVASSGLGTLR
jgi:hypothetical protein